MGSPNTRPPGSAIVAALRKLGLRARSGPADSTTTTRAAADTPSALKDGSRLDVTVLDRDRQVAGLLYRLWRRIRLQHRDPPQGHPLAPSPSWSAKPSWRTPPQAAGASTPRLVGTSEIGTEAALLAYEHTDTRALDDIPDEEIDDNLLAQIWEQVLLLQVQRLAHRRLTGDSIHVDNEGRVVLMDARSGEIAAGDLLLRLDIAQLLTYLSAARRRRARGPRGRARARPERAGRRPARCSSASRSPARPGPRCPRTRSC